MKKSLLLIMALVCTLSTKSKVNDVIIDNNRESDYSVELDDKTIIAKTVMDITSSSSIEVGSLCKMMEVVQSNDPTLLKCSVVCQIVEKRKSNIYGSEGRLIVRPLYIEKKDGTNAVLLPHDIYRRGLNRTNVKFWTSIFVIPMFIPGTGAKIGINETFAFRLE